MKNTLAIYTFAHFAVDFACFFVLFSTFYNEAGDLQNITLWFLIYNIIAFGLQFIIGYISDVKRDFPSGLIGVIIVIMGVAFAQQIYISLILIALGNAFFHVGGGIDSLVYAEGKMSRSGVFVSSGALGVALGMISGKAGIPVLCPIIFLFTSGVLIYLFCNTSDLKGRESNFNVAKMSVSVTLAITLIFVSIVIRAHVGRIVLMPWKTTNILILLTAGASFLGKLSGGFVADKFGAKTIGVSALLLSMPLLAFFNNNIILCVTGVFLFNMTMPITLCAMANRLEGFEGLAFGLTTLALLIGTAVAFFIAVSPDVAKYVIITWIIISASCIFITTKNNNQIVIEEELIILKENING